MADVAVIGCGYVGLVSAACFAELGHDVHCIDVDVARIAMLREGRTPIHEPGLDEMLARGREAGRLHFYDEYPDPVQADVVFIAVQTPPARDGAADLRAVRGAIRALAPRLRPGTVIVNKSTVPIGTGELVEGMARRFGGRGVSVVSNPEFLQEGSAVQNFMEPSRVVLGGADPQAIERVAALYEQLGAPVQRTDIRTAEMIKYASNAFLATKISFINEMAAICESLGADVDLVAEGMGSDSRIGRAFLRAGLGWGGSCFPKDTQSLAHMAAVQGTHPQLLRSVMEINADQRRRMVQKVRETLGGLEGRRVLVLGASFKPHTDDTRYSPALELSELLMMEGAEVCVFDPVVPPERITAEYPGIEVAADVLAGARGAHALILGTEWPEFREMPLGRIGAVMERRTIIDARNFLDPEAARAADFEYRCVGRPHAEYVPAALRGRGAIPTAPAVSAPILAPAATPAATAVRPATLSGNGATRDGALRNGGSPA